MSETDFTLLSGSEVLSTYTFNTRLAKHLFCNYVAVHVRGRARFMNDEAQQDAAMDALVAAFEGGAEPWSRARLTEEQYRGRVQAIYRGRVQAIRAFEIEIEHLEGVFKLSQDKPVTDQQAVIAGLERESNEPVLVEYMKRRLAGSLSGSG